MCLLAREPAGLRSPPRAQPRPPTEGTRRFEQAARFAAPAVDELTRVDIACRHLGTKRALKRPTPPDRPAARAGTTRESKLDCYPLCLVKGLNLSAGGRISYLQTAFASPLIYPGTTFVHVCRKMQYMYPRSFFSRPFLLAKRVRHAQLHVG
jgi:hypothetical protein